MVKLFKYIYAEKMPFICIFKEELESDTVYTKEYLKHIFNSEESFIINAKNVSINYHGSDKIEIGKVYLIKKIYMKICKHSTGFNCIKTITTDNIEDYISYINIFNIKNTPETKYLFGMEIEIC